MSKEIKSKNTEKYLSYAEAHRRMNSACEQKFFLEAITIQESIISDRLLSYLNGKKIISVDDPKFKINRVSFNSLIEKLGKTHELFSELNEWRENRNICVHSIAKSLPGEPTLSVNKFLEIAEKTAVLGKKLTRKVEDWHKREKRKPSP